MKSLFSKKEDEDITKPKPLLVKANSSRKKQNSCLFGWLIGFLRNTKMKKIK